MCVRAPVTVHGIFSDRSWRLNKYYIIRYKDYATILTQNKINSYDIRCSKHPESLIINIVFQIND